MSRVAWVLAAVAVLGLLAAANPVANAGTDCAPRYAFVGSESSHQHDGNTLLELPVTQPVLLSTLTLSTGLANIDATKGFVEELVLIGVSDGPYVHDGSGFPVGGQDPAFGPVTSWTTGGDVAHGNQVTDGVIDSLIVKSADGGANQLAQKTFSPAIQLQPGDVVWVNYGSIGFQTVASQDPEVQVTLTLRSC